MLYVLVDCSYSFSKLFKFLRISVIYPDIKKVRCPGNEVAENGKICIFCSQSSLYRGEEKFGSLKREFVILGVRYMEGFYESFLRGKRGGTEFGS